MKYYLSAILLCFLTTILLGQKEELKRYDILESQYLSLWESRSFDQFEKVLDEMQQIAQDIDDPALQIEVLLKKNHYYLYVNYDSRKGFNAIHRALKIAQEKGLHDYQMKVLSTMAIFQFATYSDFDSAEDYVSQMTILNKELNSEYYRLAISITSCQIYSFQKFLEFDVSADRYEYCTEALPQSLDFYQPTDFLLYRQTRFAALLGFSEFFGLEKCNNLVRDLESQPNLPVVNQNEYIVVWHKMFLLYKQGMYSEVLSMMEKSADLFPQKNNPLLKYHYALLARTYEKLGFYKESLEVNKQLNLHIQKQTESAFSDKLQALNETQKAKQYQLNNLELKQRNTIISLFTIAALLSVLVVLYFYNRLQKQKKMIQVQKDELAIVNSSKKKLFAILAHDLRAPISSLHNVGKKVKYLISKKDWLTLDKMGAQINSKLQTLDSLLANIVPWAQTQIINPTIKKERIEMNSLINQCIEEFEDRISTKNISIVNTVSDISIETDKNALQIIIRNILSNALKYSSKGAEIRVESNLKGEKLDIFVKDNGVGIPKDKLEHIFTDYTSTLGQDGEKGHGLGLKLSKDLAVWLDADLNIDSSSNKGTTVRLSMNIS